MTLQMIIAIAIFVISYIFISTEIVNKVIVSLLGGLAMIVVGVMTEKTAFGTYVDWDVLFLLIGMMIIIGIAKQTGMFQYIAIRVAKLVKGDPGKLLVVMFCVTAFISAFLPNVTTIMIVVPVTILMATELGISPTPFVIALAIASNVGGTATLIGDPPNVMIGSAIGLTFMDFVVNLSPIIAIVTIVNAFVFWLLFRKQMVVTNEKKAKILEFNEKNAIEDYPLMWKSLAVILLVVASFFLQGITHLEPATIALSGAALLMLLSRTEDVERLFAHEIEWGSIFFFIGLFIIVGGLVEAKVIDMLAKVIINFTHGNIPIATNLILWLSGVLSAIVDNIPYVATMIPLIKQMGVTMGAEHMMPLWWALSLGACLGGNGTLVGASANVVSVGISNKAGYKISFWEFTKYGALLTFISIAICNVYLYFFYI